MRRPLAIAATCLAVALAAGCGSIEDSTPAACLSGPGAYLKALEAAPGRVKVEGRTPIGECLVENQAGGELATVGGSMVTAATRLNASARGKPGGEANLRLGYLVGAAQRGAERTGGIDAELIRRLVVAARYSPDNRPLPASFLAAYQKGFDAGHRSG